MKKLVIAAVLASAPFAAQAADMPSKAKKAAPVAHVTEASVLNFDGFVGGEIGYQSTSHGFDYGAGNQDMGNDKGLNLNVHGSFETMLSSQYGLQMDAALNRTTHDFGTIQGQDLNYSTMVPTIAGHVFWRDSSKGLVGVFAQSTTTDNLLIGTVATGYTYAGVEGQYFMNGFTAYGQVAYLSASIPGASLVGDVKGDGYALAAQLRYFVDPNLMIALRGSYTQASYQYAGVTLADNSTSVVGLRAEYRLPNNPASLYADVSYNMNKIDASSSEGVKLSMDDARVMFGLNLNLGGKSLLERDRSGASLSTIDAPTTAVSPNTPQT